MKKTNCLFTLWVAALCAGTHAYAVGTAPAILSNYGEIQSVKNYSFNPFWNKNSPYNQNFPKPIYATGADLNTGDCNRVVENLVTSYCAEHNYCRNLRISDVRPTIMVQLSQLPGHNFATSCGGYIDSTFDKFQKEYGNVSTVNLPKPASQPTNIEIANPFAPKQTAAQKAIADRTAELERLQSITTPTAGVHAEYFPKTTADLSFTDRIANTAAGYEPYKDKASYKKPDFLGEDEEFFNRLRAQNFEKFCERRPDDPDCVKLYCEQHPDDEKCKKTTPAQQTDPTTPVTPPVNPPITPPNTNCPDTHMTINPTTGKCECTGKYAPKPGDPNTCICANGASIANDCTQPNPNGDQYFVWNCRIKDKYYSELNDLRQRNLSGFSYWKNYCDESALDYRDECIAFPGYTYSTAGIINRKLNELTNNHTNGVSSAIFVQDDNASKRQYLILSKTEADAFINNIKNDIKNISEKCSSKRAWWLFIDKIVNGDLNQINRSSSQFDAYYDICIGGKRCTPGEIKTH